MLKPTTIPQTQYKLFVNGAFQSKCTNYDWMFQRGLSLAMYFGLDFINTSCNEIVDKWKGDKAMIIIYKEQILYPNENKDFYKC